MIAIEVSLALRLEGLLVGKGYIVRRLLARGKSRNKGCFVQDLHKNRFKNGWFTLLKFTDQVLKKPELLDELKKFSSENTIEPDEWTEPVVVFNKPHQQAPSSQKQARSKPRFKPQLNIGVDDDDAKMLANNPHAKMVRRFFLIFNFA